MSLAPLVADGKVMVGASGGELGVRGFVAAFDVDTGKPVWKTFTVPAPGEPGSETWPAGGDQWKTGGGSIWVTGNYDPETNLAYWGTGNGGPWMGDQRPGDNLYTASTIAIDVATGRDQGAPPVQPERIVGLGRSVAADPRRLHARRPDGQGADRRRAQRLPLVSRADADGPIKFVDAQAVREAERLPRRRPEDRPAGRRSRRASRAPARRAEFCPSLWGGKNWPPIAFSPQTRLIYVPANENLCGTIIGRERPYAAGSVVCRRARRRCRSQPGADHIGEVQAWNVDTGKRVWTHSYATSPNWGPMLATAGGLVFTGGTNDRRFHAFDASTGKLLWEFPTSSGIIGQPSTFMVDGKQYVAVQSGWGIDSRAMQGRLTPCSRASSRKCPKAGRSGCLRSSSVCLQADGALDGGC